MFRLVTDLVSDRTGLHWAMPITGYTITVVSVLSFSTQRRADLGQGHRMGRGDGHPRIRVACRCRADLVPGHRHGTGYGIFTACYGLAWLASSTVIGALYSHSTTAVATYTATTEVFALALFIPLVVRPRRYSVQHRVMDA